MYIYERIVLAVKMAEFVSDTMSFIILRGRLCHIVLLNVRIPTEDKINM
jgi:hypothetical protein